MMKRTATLLLACLCLLLAGSALAERTISNLTWYGGNAPKAGDNYVAFSWTCDPGDDLFLSVKATITTANSQSSYGPFITDISSGNTSKSYSIATENLQPGDKIDVEVAVRANQGGQSLPLSYTIPIPEPSNPNPAPIPAARAEPFRQPEPAETYPTGRIRTKTPVHERASDTSATVDTLTKNTPVEITQSSIKSPWVRVRYDGGLRAGYVLKKDVIWD